MKFIAITPDWLRIDDLFDSIRLLEKNGASHVYVRSPFVLSSRDLKKAVGRLKETGFNVILPLEKWFEFRNEAFICHFKERKLSEIDKFCRLFPGVHFSASVHSLENAEEVIGKGAEFVFISPVFPPYSKKNYSLNPLELNEISELVEKFGEKVALLGGIDFERVKELKLKMKKDFSVAGITMFFGRREDR